MKLQRQTDHAAEQGIRLTEAQTKRDALQDELDVMGSQVRHAKHVCFIFVFFFDKNSPLMHVVHTSMLGCCWLGHHVCFCVAAAVRSAIVSVRVSIE